MNNIYFHTEVKLDSLYLKCGIIKKDGIIYISLFHASHSLFENKKGVCKKDSVANIMKKYYYGKKEYRESFEKDAIENNVIIEKINYIGKDGEKNFLPAFPIEWIQKKINDVYNPYSLKIEIFKEEFCEPLIFMANYKYYNSFSFEDRNYIENLTSILTIHPENFNVLATTLLPPLLQSVFKKIISQNKNEIVKHLEKTINYKSKDKINYFKESNRIDLKDIISFLKDKKIIDEITFKLFEHMRWTRNNYFHNEFPKNELEDFLFFVVNAGKIVHSIEKIITYESNR